jgi:hypothetical protein
LEPAARYARPVIPLREPVIENRPRYELADLNNGFTATPAIFYELKYQPTLRGMVAVVIRTEGPIYLELLLTRIARAHGFGRIGVTIRETITAAIDPIFPTSGQGDMTVLWPEAVVKESTPFRYGAPGVRDFWNIPDVELIGLARELSEQEITTGQIILQMIKNIGIARVTEGIRGRLAEIVGRCGGGLREGNHRREGKAGRLTSGVWTFFLSEFQSPDGRTENSPGLQPWERHAQGKCPERASEWH